MNTASSRASTRLGAIQDLGWTTLSVTAAVVLLPAIGLKALAKAAFPRKAQAAAAEERHYLIT